MDSLQREALWRWWLTPWELELYGLDATSNVGAFLSNRAWEKVVRRSLNDTAWMPLTGNKLIYGSYFSDWGVATPRSLGFLAPGRGFSRDGQLLASISDLTSWLRSNDYSSFVLKPITGAGTVGVVIVEDTRWYDDTPIFITADGRGRTQRELAGELHTAYRGVSGYIIQERLQPHSWFREISGVASNSLRVVTWSPDSEPPAVQMAVAVFGREGHMVGNWTNGGLAVGIELDSGRLVRGHIKHSGWTNTHPDTGVTIEGQVPHWEETCRLARRAALVTPGLRSVLWDVVVTEEGPVFVEGNSMWGIQQMQVHSGGLIGAPIGDAWARAGADLPDGSRRWRRRHWWKALRPAQGQGKLEFAKDVATAGRVAARSRLTKWQ